MANPTALNHYIGYDRHDVRCDGIVISGTKVLTTQQTLVADAAAATAAAAALTGAANAAVTQVAVTDSLDGATFTGTALLTSATPTVDELEAIAGMLGLAVNAAGTDIALVLAQGDKSTVDIAAQKVELDQLITDVGLIRTAVNAALDVLEAHGLMADA